MDEKKPKDPNRYVGEFSGHKPSSDPLAQFSDKIEKAFSSFHHFVNPKTQSSEQAKSIGRAPFGYSNPRFQKFTEQGSQSAQFRAGPIPVQSTSPEIKSASQSVGVFSSALSGTSNVIEKFKDSIDSFIEFISSRSRKSSSQSGDTISYSNDFSHHVINPQIQSSIQARAIGSTSPQSQAWFNQVVNQSAIQPTQQAQQTSPQQSKQQNQSIFDLLKKFFGSQGIQTSSASAGTSVSPLRSQAGSVLGNVFGNLASRIGQTIPGFTNLRNEIQSTIDSFKKQRQFLEHSQKFGASSPLGLPGLENLRRFAGNPFIKEKERNQLLGQISTAEYYTKNSERLRAESVRSSERATNSRGAHADSMVELARRENEKSRADAQLSRVAKLRDQIKDKYNQTFYKHHAMNLAKPGSSIYASDLKYYQKQLGRANSMTNRAASRARSAGAKVRSARAQVQATGAASRKATRTANVARRSSIGATTVARQTAATAQSTASAIAGSLALRAFASTVTSGLGAFAGFVGLVKLSRDALNHFAENINDSNRRLAGFNGGIAQAFGRLAMGDIRRNFTLGAGTERTAVALTDAIDKMRDNQMQLNVSSKNIFNMLASVASGAVGGFDKEVGKFTNEIDRLMEGVGIGRGANAAESITSTLTNLFTGIPTMLLKTLNDWWFGVKPGIPVPKMNPADEMVNAMARNKAQHKGMRMKPLNRVPGFGKI